MDKKIVFIASIKGREQQLKIVIDALYEQVDLIYLVLNWYEEIPKWISALEKVRPHLNLENKNAHDSVWVYVEAENIISKLEKRERYFFICDDDLLYPADYIDKLIETIDKYDRRVVVTVHGAVIQKPVESYFQCRLTHHFITELKKDKLVDMAGCGTVGFHSSTIQPNISNFPVVFCRDLWFSILCKKLNVSIICIKRLAHWIEPIKTSGDTVFEASNRNEKLKTLKDRILKEIFAPLLFLTKPVPVVVKTPKVSVIMPVYNGIRFLDRAIKSILDQTEKDFEFIIIDDGSTEPVWDKIRSYTDSRIQAYRTVENKGLTFRLNQCLQMAKGDYIVRMDADDVSLPTRIEKQLLRFEDGAGFVGCWAGSLDELGNSIKGFVDIHCRCSDESIRIKYPKTICMADPTSIYSKAAIRKIGYFDPEVYTGETYNYNLRIQQFFIGRVVQEVLYLRTIRHDSIMRTVKHDSNIDIIALAKQRALEVPIIKDIL